MSKMNQEQRIAYLQKNDWSTAPVPKEYRRSDYGVVVTLVGQIIALSGIYIGAGMVGGLTLTQAFIATLLGSCILAVWGFPCCCENPLARSAPTSCRSCCCWWLLVSSGIRPHSSVRRSTPCFPAADGLPARQQLVSGAVC